MGGKHGNLRNNYNRWRLSKKRETSKLKAKTYCPICNLEFKSWQTYGDFNYHIDNCLAVSDLSQNISEPKRISKLTTIEEKCD